MTGLDFYESEEQRQQRDAMYSEMELPKFGGEKEDDEALQIEAGGISYQSRKTAIYQQLDSMQKTMR